MKYLVLGVLCVAIASEARAEIVVFKNGRTMSVKSHKIVADMATLAMRDGGEVTFPASIIERVDPDEVPYPETMVADAAEVLQAPRTRLPSMSRWFQTRCSRHVRSQTSFRRLPRRTIWMRVSCTP